MYNEFGFKMNRKHNGKVLADLTLALRKYKNATFKAEPGGWISIYVDVAPPSGRKNAKRV